MTSVLYIGNKLLKSKTNVSYINVLGDLLSQEGISVYYASSYHNKALRLFDMIAKTMALKRKVNYVLIDTYSTQNFYFAFIISQLCRIFKLQYIPILHGGNLPNRLKKSPKMSAMIFENAKCNVSPSLYLKHAFEDLGYHNVTYIPNTLEIENYSFTKKAFATPQLLWVRSFSKIYNPQLAVNVLNVLKASYPKAELCMVGPDSDGSLQEVKALAKALNLEIKFTGKLTKTEWLVLSNEYNIFINTTNYDNTPVSVMEAMALGLPVVSTNVGGMPYLITSHKDGILVPPNSVEEMVQAIDFIMTNETNRDQIIKKARHKVEQFDWNIIKTLWFQTLEHDNC